MKLNALLSRAEVKKEWSRVIGLCHSLPSRRAPESVKVAVIPFIVSPNAHNFFGKSESERDKFKSS